MKFGGNVAVPLTNFILKFNSYQMNIFHTDMPLKKHLKSQKVQQLEKTMANINDLILPKMEENINESWRYEGSNFCQVIPKIGCDQISISLRDYTLNTTCLPRSSHSYTIIRIM